ncbi:MAG: patatin-like phospholipase family protein [Flavobacteriaceae bacterium]
MLEPKKYLIISTTNSVKKIVFLICLLLSFVATSQNERPKVGLVLSGGGAKGFAHIGVLKEIEKSGIKIDYIGGTSMGAIVGGLYASGYSALQIEEMVKEIDFMSLLQDKLPRNALPFFEKEFGEKYGITLPVKKNKIRLPKGVSKGQNVLNLLTYLLSPVDSISDFSKLPIPFFCIGTDIETGNQVVLEKGYLPLALRASGSFPTFLNPVEIDGKLVIDGGVVNNFPAEYMKSKSVDFIIGVDVQGKLINRKKLNSVVAILNQIISFQTYGKSEAQKKYVDVYIKPDIYDFSAADFAKKNEILKKGDEIAKKFKEVFRKIASLQNIKNDRKLLVKDQKKYYLNKIKVSGTNKYTRAYVLGKLNLQITDSISYKELNKKIDFLSATNNYERIQYVLNKSDEENELHISLIEQKEKANIRLGVHYDQLYESGLLLDYNNNGLLIKNDQLSIDLVLGDRVRYNLNYFVDNGFYVSYGFRSRYNQFNTNTKFSLQGNQNLSKINLSYTDFTNSAFLQTTFGRKFAMGGGVELKKLKITTETVGTGNSNSTVFDNSSYFNVLGYLKLDTYDKSYFPNKGFYADLGFKWYAWSSDYNKDFTQFQQLKGTLGFASTFFEKLTFQYTNEAGFSFNSPESDVFDFYLGGYNKNYINTFSSLYGYEFGDATGNTFLKSEFEFRYEFAKNNYATFIANYARVDNNVFADGNLFEDVLSGYAIGYSLKTFIGPVEVKYSWSPDTKNHFWLFNLGFWF